MDSTLLGMRDFIIRSLGYPTQADVLTTQASQAGTQPDPLAVQAGRGKPPNNIAWLTPQLMNQCISTACSDINLSSLDFAASAPLIVNVPAQSAYGPAYVQLAQGFNTFNNQIDRMRSARWLTSGNTSYDPLQMTGLQELDRNGYDWRGAPPQIPPLYLAIEAYEIWLIPGPAIAGQLSILAVIGLVAPERDFDTLQQLPTDLYPQFMTVATQYVAETQANDPVMSQYATRYEKRAQMSFKRVVDTMSAMNDSYEPQVTADIGRISRMRR